MDSQNSQILLPPVELKHRDMIEAVTLGKPFSAFDLMEQAARHSPICCRCGVEDEPDDPTSALINDEKHPMGFESKGLTPEKIKPPQAILHCTHEGQPQGSTGSFRTIVGGNYPKR